MTNPRDLEGLARRCLVLGFDGHTLTNDARRLIESGVGGVILFHRNIGSADQVRELTDSIREASPIPVLCSVDQEGGRVARLRGIATDFPPMRRVACFGPQAAERIGAIMADELSALGFDIAFAPVADVDTNPNNPVIGDRSFSSDPAEVARLSSALAKGLEEGGVAACGKHFPGHGDTEIDSHLDMPRVPHDRQRLVEVELVPFRALCRAKVAAIMTAHVSVEAVDPGTPATMSPKVLSILRDELGFAGVIFTDDMEMEAVAGRYEFGDAVVRAVGAGCDQVLVCHLADRQARAVEALIEAVEDGRLPRARLEQAASRLEALASRFSPTRTRFLPEEVLRSKESLHFASGLFEEIAGGAGDPTGAR